MQPPAWAVGADYAPCSAVFGAVRVDVSARQRVAVQVASLAVAERVCGSLLATSLPPVISNTSTLGPWDTIGYSYTRWSTRTYTRIANGPMSSPPTRRVELLLCRAVAQRLVTRTDFLLIIPFTCIPTPSFPYFLAIHELLNQPASLTTFYSLFFFPFPHPSSYLSLSCYWCLVLSLTVLTSYPLLSPPSVAILGPIVRTVESCTSLYIYFAFLGLPALTNRSPSSPFLPLGVRTSSTSPSSRVTPRFSASPLTLPELLPDSRTHPVLDQAS